MNRNLLSTFRIYCLSIIVESPRVSFIIVPHVYTPALEMCTLLITRSNDRTKSSIALPIKVLSIVLRGLRY